MGICSAAVVDMVAELIVLGLGSSHRSDLRSQ